MRNILFFGLVLLCWNTALAQDDAPPGDTPGGETQVEGDTAGVPDAETDGALETGTEEGVSSIIFENYFSEDFGLTIPIPSIGVMRTPGDLGWNQEPEVVFVWKGENDSPVAMIELRADDIGAEITPEQYAHFYDSLVSEWENQPNQFKVLRSRAEPYYFGEMDWLIIEVEDSSSASKKGDAPAAGEAPSASETVYYTIFTTYHNEVFYTIGFYYLRPVSEAVQDLAVPMLRGFSVIGKEV